MPSKQQFCSSLSHTISCAATAAPAVAGRNSVIRIIARTILIVLAMAILCVPAALLAQSSPAPLRIYGGVIVAVDSHAGPWLQSLNPAYDYGAHDNAAPTVVNSANSGISFTAGNTITITYMSGLVSAGGSLPYTDANGDTTSKYGCGPGLTEPNKFHLPCFYTDLSRNTYLMALIGCSPTATESSSGLGAGFSSLVLSLAPESGVTDKPSPAGVKLGWAFWERIPGLFPTHS
jgi:hypothetical protein